MSCTPLHPNLQFWPSLVTLWSIKGTQNSGHSGFKYWCWHLGLKYVRILRHLFEIKLNKKLLKGYGPSDAESVKRHPFFKTINWDDLLRRNVPAPFVPNISNNLDVSNFSVEFTEMPPVDSPADVPVAFDVFKGYSFTGEFANSKQASSHEREFLHK